MIGKHLSIPAVCWTLALAPSWAVAGGIELRPHRASYDLSLAGTSEEVQSAEGRIAIELARPDCDAYDLDYRFVARFAQADEVFVTDQQSRTREWLDGERFEFETRTFVDGADHKEIRGSAVNEGGATVVTMEAPADRRIELPLSTFPMRHTHDILAAAEAGTRIVETALFDGDDEAEKLLRSTAIISEVGESASAGEEGAERPAGAAALEDLRAWRISESFYNRDSNEDGMPIFETAFTLYENGVSDDLLLKFEGYGFQGSLASLDFLDEPSCG